MSSREYLCQIPKPIPCDCKFISPIFKITEEIANPMDWASPKFTRDQVIKAGKILAQENPDPSDYDYALEVVNNWRAIHGFPLNTFQIRLRTCARQVYPRTLVSQRIKRVSSIVDKIRNMDMRLPTMQDIAGCRAIVDTISQVRRLHSEYYDFDIKIQTGSYRGHKQVKVNDYIECPKIKTGYRSLHLIYEYFSTKNEMYNGRKIEIQLRTKLQHAWSTAVETVQTFTGLKLKTGFDESQWRDFFKLASSAFAMIEGTSPVDGITNNRSLLRRQIAKELRNLNVEENLQKYSGILNITKGKIDPKDHYYVLVLNPSENTLRIFPFKQNEFNQAMQKTVDTEKNLHNIAGANTVLVSVNSLKDLRRSYPNYFLDTKYFIESIKKFLH